MVAPLSLVTAWPSAELRFRAMGSDAHLLVVGPGAEARTRAARLVVERLEASWSRFLPDSEVSRLNRRAGETVTVGAETLQLVTLAEYAHTVTNGRFDATLGINLVGLGYDRSFELLDRASETAPDGPAQHDRIQQRVEQVVPSRLGRFGDRPHVDHQASTVRLAPGTAFDPGGIGKGLAADLVACQVMADGAWGVLISLGGDLRVAGTPPSGESWIVAVAHSGAGVVTHVSLTDGGLATSSVGHRRWLADPTRPLGLQLHHVLDPVTGLPHDGGAEHITVVAGAAWWAEIAATSLIGRDPATPIPDDCAALLSTSGPSGGPAHHRLGGFERYEVPTAATEGIPA